MMKNKCVPFFGLFFGLTFFGLLLLLCTGCDVDISDSDLEIKPNPIKAPPELIEKIKSTDWLESWHTCGLMSMSNTDYKECILVDAALLPPLDPAKRDHFAQFYDPKKYYDCRIASKKGDAGCYKYKLRRDEPDPVWPYPDVPPIKWPEAPKESVYKWHMNSKEYFAALCEAEAGKFIYKTVEDVEGVYQIRPRNEAGDFRLMDKYVLENPYHHSDSEARSTGAAYLGINHKNNRHKYQFLETSLFEPKNRWRDFNRRYHHKSMEDKPPVDANYIRYEGYEDGEIKNITKTYTQKLKSRYGYVWRGIERPHDREYAIAGGEFAVVDLRTNEILALWRGFLLGGKKSSMKVWWLSGVPCPAIRGDNTEFSAFVMDVLKPKQSH